MDYVEVQVEVSGNWQTVCNCPNDSQVYTNEMRNVKNIYPDRRVRTVDKDGRLLDLMV